MFHGLKSWFAVMNFFIFSCIFISFVLFLRLFYFVRYSFTILIMDNFTLCCMSLQILARFMGDFKFDLQLGQLGMK